MMGREGEKGIPVVLLYYERRLYNHILISQKAADESE